MVEIADRKAETRRRVVKVAAHAVRRHGPDGVGVAAIMREAGLTHGGFYAHFPSKDALVAEAVAEMLAGGKRRFERIAAGRTGRAALEAFVDVYVSDRHRDGPEHGCPLAVMPSEVARQPAAVREAFDAGVRALVARIASHLPPETLPSPQTRARSLLSEMAGAVALSRAVSDRGESDALLAAARESVKARLGPPPTVSEPA